MHQVIESWVTKKFSRIFYRTGYFWITVVFWSPLNLFVDDNFGVPTYFSRLSKFLTMQCIYALSNKNLDNEVHKVSVPSWHTVMANLWTWFLELLELYSCCPNWLSILPSQISTKWLPINWNGFKPISQIDKHVDRTNISLMSTCL